MGLFRTAVVAVSAASLVAVGGGAALGAGSVESSDQSAMVVVRPQEINDLFVDNPGMGWALIDNAIPGHEVYSTKKHRDPVNYPKGGEPYEDYPQFGNVAVLSDWAELEPEPGKYDWRLVDEAIAHWSARGKRIQFRIATEAHVIIGYERPDPDPLRKEVYNRGTPEWLTDPNGAFKVAFSAKCHDAASALPDCAPSEPWTKDQGGLDPDLFKRIYYVPDYENPVYQQRLQSFLKAFGAHFDGNPNLETVDLMGYGEWGEWHSGHDFTSIQARETYLRKVVQWWSEAFPHKVLGLSASGEYRHDVLPDLTNPPDLDTFKQWHAFDYTFTTPNVGFRRDGFTGCMTQFDAEVMREAWRDPRRLPISAEFCGGFPEVKMPVDKDWQPESLYLRRMDEGLSYHANYMTVMGWSGDEGAYQFATDPVGQRITDEGNRRLGYRLVLSQATYPRSVKPGGALELRQDWANRSVGRLWQGQRLRVYLVNGAGQTVWSDVDGKWNGSDILEEHPATKVSRFTLPKNLASGQYSLRIALVGADRQPAVRLAISGNDGGTGFGRYPLGQITVGTGTGAGAGATGAEDFEGGTLTSSSFSGGTGGTTGSVTSDPALVVAGAHSATGSAPMTTPWIDVLYSDATKLRLRPLTSYRVDFGYRTNTAPAPDGSHYFLVRTPTGGYAQDLAFTQWNEPASATTKSRSVSFTTGAFDDYYLMWGLHNGGSISLDDIRVVEQGFESFEGGSFPATDYSGGTNGNSGSLTNASGERIAGTWSVKGCSPASVAWKDILTSDNTKLRLRPLTAYTVGFSYRVLSRTASGQNYFLARTNTGGLAHDVGFSQWSEAATPVARTRSFSFTTDAYGDYYLVWGLRNGGCLVLDDIWVQASADLATGQVLNLTFENAGSSVPNAVGPETATLQAGATLGQGRRGNGLVVGGGSYAEVSPSPSLDGVQQGSYTVSASFRAAQLPTEDHSGADPYYSRSYAIVTKPGWHTGLWYDFEGRFHMSECFNGPECTTALSLYKYAPGEWHTVTGVVNWSRGQAAGYKGSITLYVDGQWQVTSVFDEARVPYAYGSSPWRLGTALPGTDHWYWPASGTIDDVRIWNRALTVGEAQVAGFENPAHLSARATIPGSARKGKR